MVPRSFCVAGHRFRVEYDNTITSSGACGMMLAQHLMIKIDPNQEQSIIEETFIHEMIEAINYIYELELDHPKIQTLGAAIHHAMNSSRGELK